MPSGPFAHVCLLVNDLDKAVEDWTKILSALDPGQLERQIVRYDDFDGGGDAVRWATFVNDHGAEIQLMEPGPTRTWASGWPSTASTCTTSASPPTTRRRSPSDSPTRA